MRSLSLQANTTHLIYQTLRVSQNGRNGSLVEFLTPASIVGQTHFPIKRSSSLVPQLVWFLNYGFLFADSGQVSGVEISRDIIRHVRKLYQSIRVSNTKLNHYGLGLRYLVECIAQQMWAHECFLFCFYVHFIYLCSSKLQFGWCPQSAPLKCNLGSRNQAIPPRWFTIQWRASWVSQRNCKSYFTYFISGGRL